MQARFGAFFTVRLLGLLMALCISLAALPRDASAQLLPATLGFAGGLIGGAYVTTGAYVLKSRATGWVLHTPAELLSARLEALPVVIGPVSGAILGYRDRRRLAAAMTWGGVGLVSGAFIGAGFGQLIWNDSEGRWAGGTIGSAAGLAIGVIVGALTHRNQDEAGDGGGGARAPFVTFSIPLGGR